MIVALIAFWLGAKLSGPARWALWGFGAWTLYGSLRAAKAVLETSSASAKQASLLTGVNYDQFNPTGVDGPKEPRIY